MSATVLSLDDIIRRKNNKPLTTTDSTLSLDDIIRKNNIRFGNQDAPVKPVKRLGKSQPLETTAKKNNIVTDARNRIQNNTQSMGDARDQLNKLSRQGDARDRLNKLKKVKFGVAATRIGKPAVQARLTGKAVGTAVLRTQGNIIKPTGNRPVAFRNNHPNMNQQGMRNNHPNMNQQGMRNNHPNMNQQGMRAPMKQMQVRTQNVRMQHAPYQPQRMRSNVVLETRYPQERVYRQAQPATYRDTVYDELDAPITYRDTVYEEMDAPVTYRDTEYDDELDTVYDDEFDTEYGDELDTVYDDELDAPITYRDTVYDDVLDAPINYRDTVYVDEFGAPIRKKPVYVEVPRSRPAPIRKRPVYVAAPRSRPAPVRASNLAARIGQQQPRQQLRPQPQPQPQQGHKVLVTNLHPSVSEEDMEELFSTIGKIIGCRIVMKGVAEAIFLKEESALKFVQVFHNRSLDGQRMSVNLVKKRSNVQRGPQPRGRTGYY